MRLIKLLLLLLRHPLAPSYLKCTHSCQNAATLPLARQCRGRDGDREDAGLTPWGHRTTLRQPCAFDNRRTPPTCAAGALPQLHARALIFDDLPPGTSKELGKCVARDAALLRSLGWTDFVKHHKPCGDFASLEDINHSAKQLLLNFKNKGVTVNISTAPWTTDQVDTAISRNAHPSYNKSLVFMCEECVDMINKGQFVVLPLATC